jgi:hypothetical protein
MTFAKGPPPGHGGDPPLELSSYGGVDLQEIKQNRPEAQARNARMRRQRLVLHLHRLGPSPLFHFLAEIEGGDSIQDTLETYGRLPVEFVRALGGDRFAPIVHVIDG